MLENAKQFAERLNKCLDDNDAPIAVRERAQVLSRMLDISKQQAWSLLEGQQMPDETLLKQIADEFEVDVQWLTGHE